MANPITEGILLGLGNPLLDITVVCPDSKLLDKYDLLSNNAILAEEKHRPLFEDMVQNYEVEYLPGGATLNSVRVAQWLLQKPKASTFFGGVGKDKFADILEKKSVDVGVNVRYQVIEAKQTGVCGAIITGEERSLVTELGAAQCFNIDFLKQPENWKLVEAAQCYYAGGFILPVSKESVLALAQHSSEMNKTLVMNLHATFLCGMFADPALNLMPFIDILFANSDEAAVFCPLVGIKTTDLKEMALQVAALPKANTKKERIVVFTQGRDPTVIAHLGKAKEYPVEAIEPGLIKDTNGCGDSFVEILKGRDKGKHGIVCQVIKERNWCYVEGLNYKYNVMNKSATNPGSMVRVEKPLLVTTEVSLVDPSDEKATGVQWRYTEEGEKVRVSTRTGRIIPLSRDEQYADPEDGVNTLDFKETAKDTTEAVLTKITYEPKLKTFEQDLMDEFGIKEDRQPAPTYFY